MSARRLETGGRIDRTRTLRFLWDGRELTGYTGDTLASALMANGNSPIRKDFSAERRAERTQLRRAPGIAAVRANSPRRPPRFVADTAEFRPHKRHPQILSDRCNHRLVVGHCPRVIFVVGD